MPQIEIFSEEHTLESSSIIELRHTHHMIGRQPKRDVGLLQYLPIISEIIVSCLKMFFTIDKWPSIQAPPPPDNDRVCDHNAMLAFPQEKNYHYTTEHNHPKPFIYSPPASTHPLQSY